MRNGRVVQMVRGVERIQVERAREQLAVTLLPMDPGCRGACSRRPGRPGELRGRQATGLVALLARIPADEVARLNALAARTRVLRSTYLREAVSDLLMKYGEVP